MDLRSQVLEALADCCDYPRPQLADRARDAAGALAREPGAGAGAERAIMVLEALAAWAASAGTGEVEERYTQLFDLKPVATLNVSHHVLGDTYQRGALLAGLAGELNRVGIPHRHDLPDYLPTLLRLLGAIVDAEDRRLLVHVIILPGLQEVVQKLESSPGPYPSLLRALCDLLAEAIPAGDEEMPVLPKQSEVSPCSI